MKKTLLILAVLLAAVSCGNKNKKKSQTDPVQLAVVHVHHHVFSKINSSYFHATRWRIAGSRVS